MWYKLNIEFSTEESPMVARQQFLAIREMQSKTTLRYHLTPLRMAKIENSNDSLRWRECVVRRTLIHCWWECKLVQPLWKSVWRFLRKLGINLPQDPGMPFLGKYLRMLNYATRTFNLFHL